MVPSMDEDDYIKVVANTQVLLRQAEIFGCMVGICLGALLTAAIVLILLAIGA